MTDLPAEAITAPDAFDIRGNAICTDDRCECRSAMSYRAGAAAERARIRRDTDTCIAELRDSGDERGALWLEAFRIGLLGGES